MMVSILIMSQFARAILDFWGLDLLHEKKYAQLNSREQVSIYLRIELPRVYL